MSFFLTSEFIMFFLFGSLSGRYFDLLDFIRDQVQQILRNDYLHKKCSQLLDYTRSPSALLHIIKTFGCQTLKWVEKYMNKRFKCENSELCGFIPTKYNWIYINDCKTKLILSWWFPFSQLVPHLGFSSKSRGCLYK